MSKDIRSFFKVQSGSKAKSKPPEPVTSKAAQVILSDDDVIPESPDVHHKSKQDKNSKKKRRIIDDSSDEDTSKNKKDTNRRSSKPNSNNKKPIKSPLKQVSAADMFGSAPIKRTELPKKNETVNKPNVKTENGNKSNREAEIAIHSDDDFEKTLLQIDDPTDVTCDIKENTENKNKEINDIKNLNIEEHVTPESTMEKSNHLNGADNGSQTPKHHNDDNTKTPNDSNIPKTPNHSDTLKTPNDSNTSKKPSDSKIPKTPNDSNISKAPSDSKISSYKIPKKQNTDIKVSPKKESTKKSEKKRDFSEFLEMGSQSDSQNDDTPTSKSKKRKCDQSLSESVASDEERFEKRRHSAMLYQKYLNRTGPKSLGSKEIPEGTPNCLKDLSFVLTGVLNSFERGEVTEAIQRYGGTIKSGVSKKVTHVLAGDDAGPAKLSKAEDLGLRILNEDQFLDLIRQRSDPSGNEPTDSRGGKEKDIKKEKEHREMDENNIDKHLTDKWGEETTRDIKKEQTPVKEIKAGSFYKNKQTEEDARPSTSKVTNEPMDTDDLSSKDSKSGGSISGLDTTGMMWVEKYKPRNVKQIIGQNGDASNVKKLSNWLTRWYINRKEKLNKPSPWAKNDDGGYYKAALLSGPPGIGKTTTVSLVCAELGFDVVEFNASDTRSKSLIKQQISELLTTTSLAGFVNGQNGRKAVSKKHVLVMDEVDGMAGNEDRGGLQELISLIKLTAVPIICMCNDRNSTKMRSLVNYCYDLRFNRPRVDQIKSAMMSVCFKEGVKIAPDALTQLIVSSQQDVRQTLNLLSLWSVRADHHSSAVTVKKDVRLGPWEVIRKVFSEEEQKKMSIHDKSDLFFYDYSIAPLFVQENYLQVAPHCPKNEVLKRVSRAADSICRGDLVEAKIRGSGAWNLLPVQALYSSVIPGHEMRGHVAGQIQFPGWLGKNSRANKMKRLAQEIHAHTRLSMSGSKSAIYMDYCRQLRDAIVQPLATEKAEGIPRALEVLQAYHLLREDLDSLTELALWPGQRDPMILVDSKVKAAMTRTYNKEAATLPYAQAGVRKARAGAAASEADSPPGEDEPEVEEDSDSDPEHDAMIRKKKKPAPSSKDAGTSETKNGKGKKGKGKS